MSDRTSRISTLDCVISYFSPTFGIKRIRAKAAIDAFAYGGGGCRIKNYSGVEL